MELDTPSFYVLLVVVIPVAKAVRVPTSVLNLMYVIFGRFMVVSLNNVRLQCVVRMKGKKQNYTLPYLFNLLTHTASGPPLRPLVSLKTLSCSSGVGELLPERDLDCGERSC